MPVNASTLEASVTTATTQTYADTSTKSIGAASGVDYAYRDVGTSTVPLVLLQHFRGNLDNWDPALIDALAAHRRVVVFDNVGVGATNGATPNTVEQMAADAITFVDAMGFDGVDILGFSIGSFVAQEIALTRPALVRNLILASAAPKGAAGMHGWAPWVVDAVGKQQLDPAGYLRVFFAESASSQQAGQQALQRMFTKTSGFDQPTTWQTRQAQYDAVCAWGIPNHALLQRLSAVQHRVFIANGDSDPMILPHFSYLLAGLIPGSELKIYRDSAHGFLFQHHAELAADVERFLRSNDIGSASNGGQR
jgi:pimeloyl-ACP methyl ester carboxylesterase